MAYRLYQKLISAMADEGVCNASDVDMSASVNGTSYSKAGAIINAIISFINGLSTTLSNLVSTGLKRKIVQTLPTGNNISETTIYLMLKNPAGESGDIYDEYMYINNNWEHIGSTAVDLTNYVQKPSNISDGKRYVMRNGAWAEADAAGVTYSGSVNGATNVASAIDALVPDATLARQLKEAIGSEVGNIATESIVAGTIVFHNGRFYRINNNIYEGDRWGIEIEATPTTLSDVQNVQSDWAVTDETSDAFIKNKPDASGIEIQVISGLDANTIQGALEKILELGVAGQWFAGTEVSGIIPETSIDGAKVGDFYLNTDIGSEWFGMVYRLVKFGSTNRWNRVVNITSKVVLNTTTYNRETQTTDGYSHAYLDITNGGVTSRGTDDLMAPVNDVLDAIDKIMNPSTASLTASSENE